jgi:hypothetical protein
VRVDQRRLAARDPLARGLEQWAQEAVDVFGRAVVGVERDAHVVPFGELARHRRERAGARSRVTAAREVACAADRDLHDAVRARLREPAQRPVQRLRGGDIDRRVGVAAVERRVEHPGVLPRRRNAHAASLPRGRHFVKLRSPWPRSSSPVPNASTSYARCGSSSTMDDPRDRARPR